MVDTTETQPAQPTRQASPTQHASEIDEVIWHRVAPPTNYSPTAGATETAEVTAAHATKYVPPRPQVNIVPKQRLNKTEPKISKLPHTTNLGTKKHIETYAKQPAAQPQDTTPPTAQAPSKHPPMPAPPPAEPDAVSYLATLPLAPPTVQDAQGNSQPSTRPKPKRVRRLGLPGVLRRRQPKHQKVRAERPVPQIETDTATKTKTETETSTHLSHLPAPSYGSADPTPATPQTPPPIEPQKTAPPTPLPKAYKPVASPMADTETLAEQIEVDGVTLAEMFKEKQLDEAGLTRAVVAHQAGKDIKNLVTAETARVNALAVQDPMLKPRKTRKKHQLNRASFRFARKILPLFSKFGEFVGSLGQNATKGFTFVLEQLRDKPQARVLSGVIAIIGLYALIIFLLIAG